MLPKASPFLSLLFRKTEMMCLNWHPRWHLDEMLVANIGYPLKSGQAAKV